MSQCSFVPSLLLLLFPFYMYFNLRVLVQRGKNLQRKVIQVKAGVELVSIVCSTFKSIPAICLTKPIYIIRPSSLTHLVQFHELLLEL